MNTIDIRNLDTYNEVLKEINTYAMFLSQAENIAKGQVDSLEKDASDINTLFLSLDYECIIKCKEELDDINKCVILLQRCISSTPINEQSVNAIIRRMQDAIDSLSKYRSNIHNHKLKYLASGKAHDSIVCGEYWKSSEDSIDCVIRLKESIIDAMSENYEMDETIAQQMNNSSVCSEESSKPNASKNIDNSFETSQNEVKTTEQLKKPEKVKVAKFNKVDFSVITDEEVKKGQSSCVDVLMYTKGQRHIVDDLIRHAKRKKTEAAKSVSQVSVKQGSNVTVLLSSNDAIIEDDSETMIWNGDALDFQFRFSVPDDYKKKQIDFACEILFDDIHISRLYFTIKLNCSKSVPVRFVRKDSRKAFVSYSHKDRQRVVDRLIAIQEVAPRIRFWMDNQSMNAGELWRKAIVSAIKSSDVFLLFWSSNSKASSEVEKEWRYALELEKRKGRMRSGARFITPVSLEKPSECPPPDELSNLHFGDPSFDADVEGIEDVRFVVNKVKPRNIKFLG